MRKAGLRRDAVRSPVIDALEAQAHEKQSQLRFELSLGQVVFVLIPLFIVFVRVTRTRNGTGA
jgi:hypothetical protein